MTTYTVNNTEQEKKIYCGREYEHNLTTNTQYNYIYVGDMPIALYVQGDTNAMYTLHTNYIGSIEKITNTAGEIVDSMSYTPFGQRRSVTEWTRNDTVTHLIDRGFTGQQHLDNFALINFNGRMYDPVLAHFLSPDPYIQSPENPLNYNRYSYCLFSPLQYVDPSGEMIDDYFDVFGNYLGSDDALSDNIRIIDKDIWDMYKYTYDDGTEAILHHIGKYESVAFSEAFDMSQEAQLLVYQHYNPTDLPLKPKSSDKDKGKTFGLSFVYYTLTGASHIEIQLKGNAKHEISNHANEITNLFIHEEQHYNDCKSHGSETYSSMLTEQKEKNAINTQMKHSSFNKTRPWFQQKVKEYGKQFGLNF